MKIRKAIPQDAENIHSVHMLSIQKLCAKDYTTEQIQAWGHRPFRKKKWLDAINNHFVWVVDDDDVIKGFCHMIVDKENSEIFGDIVGLYLSPEVTGKGLGKNLLKVCEQKLKQINIYKIKLSSTLTSEEFYLKMGFQKTADRNYQRIQNIEIPGIPMEKNL